MINLLSDLFVAVRIQLGGTRAHDVVRRRDVRLGPV